MIQKIIPVLPAINIQDTIMFYESKLGFTAFDQGGYAILQKDGIELHFFLSPNSKNFERSACHIKVTDIECLYTDLSKMGIVSIEGKLEGRAKGIKEFSVKDNNGNQLKFTGEATY
jgi:hypothetical protein